MRRYEDSNATSCYNERALNDNCTDSRKRSATSSLFNQEYASLKRCNVEGFRAKDVKKMSWAPKRPTCIVCLKFFGTVDKAGCCSKCYSSATDIRSLCVVLADSIFDVLSTGCDRNLH